MLAMCAANSRSLFFFQNFARLTSSAGLLYSLSFESLVVEAMRIQTRQFELVASNDTGPSSVLVWSLFLFPCSSHRFLSVHLRAVARP